VYDSPTPTTGITLIRNEPVQARSTARLAALLDAAAEAVDELGYERLTTAMVADRAGASIGTVYRYFPDRVAVLQSLAARNEERAVVRVIDVIAAPDHRDWLEAMVAAFDVLVDLFRVEPGFAAIRLGDVLSLRPAEGIPRNTVLADSMYDTLVRRYNLPVDDEARFAFEAAIEIADALVARAFARDPRGDERYLAQARRAVAATLSEHFATPVA
jgi:AcrR family transcriptional regulator